MGINRKLLTRGRRKRERLGRLEKIAKIKRDKEIDNPTCFNNFVLVIQLSLFSIENSAKDGIRKNVNLDALHSII